MASRIAWSLMALAGAGCMSEAMIDGFTPVEPARVVTDVGYGPGNSLWVRSCALHTARRSLAGRQTWVSDCELRVRAARSDGAIAADEPIARVPTVAPTGVLGVMSFPSGARIEVDGREAGRSPVIVQRVAPGTHGIRAVWVDGAAATVEQEVVAGRSAMARVYRP